MKRIRGERRKNHQKEWAEWFKTPTSAAGREQRGPVGRAEEDRSYCGARSVAFTTVPEIWIILLGGL